LAKGKYKVRFNIELTIRKNYQASWVHSYSALSSSRLPSDSSPDERSARLALSFRQSRKEFWFMIGAWGFFGLWVLLSAQFSAYRGEGKELVLVLGLPAWVFWGILLPWLVAMVVTIWFAGWGMQDTEFDSGDDETPTDTGKVEDR
jgi:uncharacterized membrane protein YhaH (DUF805 family)